MNENKARLTAFFVMVLAVLFMLTSYWAIILFLAVDFFLRAFNWGAYSLLGVLSDQVIRLFKIKNKPVDRAPKRFAAGVGLAFSMAILLLLFFGFPITAGVVACALIFFAFLESAMAFCAGCYVYSFGKKIFVR
jgi:hypothetical protein